jgi:hypothetical protein
MVSFPKPSLPEGFGWDLESPVALHLLQQRTSGDAIRFRILESVSRTPQPQAAPGDPAVERVLKAEPST